MNNSLPVANKYTQNMGEREKKNAVYLRLNINKLWMKMEAVKYFQFEKKKTTRKKFSYYITFSSG